MESVEAEARVWKTLIIVGGVSLTCILGGASYCGKTVSDNYRARSVACIEAKHTWISDTGGGICLAK